MLLKPLKKLYPEQKVEFSITCKTITNPKVKINGSRLVYEVSWFDNSAFEHYVCFDSFSSAQDFVITNFQLL